MADIQSDICCSTEFIEYGDNLFTREIDGLLFELKSEPEFGKLLLCMGTANATDVKRRHLEEKLSSLLLSKEKITFFEYYVMVTLRTDQDYTDRLNCATDILVQWAKESYIRSGCFLCGKSGESVMIRQLDGISSYICDECEDSNLQQKNFQEEDEKFLQSKKIRKEQVPRGVLFSLLARAALSVILIPFIVSILLSDCSYYGVELPAIIVGFLVTIPSIILISLVYRKNAGHVSLLGYSFIVVWTILSLAADIAISLLIANQMSLAIMGNMRDSKLIGILQNPKVSSVVNIDDLGVYTTRVPTRNLVFANGIISVVLSIVSVVFIDYFWHDEENIGIHISEAFRRIARRD